MYLEFRTDKKLFSKTRVNNIAATYLRFCDTEHNLDPPPITKFQACSCAIGGIRTREIL